MENENIETQTNDIDTDYIETIKELKTTTVPKSRYEKLEADHKKLLNSLLEGGEIDAAAISQQKRSSEEIRNELFGADAESFNNLTFIEKALELRDAILDEGGVDPFVPQGSKIVAEESDFAAAEKVASALKSCIEYANGDSEIFTNELMRITVDTAPISTRVRGSVRR